MKYLVRLELEIEADSSDDACCAFFEQIFRSMHDRDMTKLLQTVQFRPLPERTEDATTYPAT